jgi:peptide/nickel transport system ATP-binding protein
VPDPLVEDRREQILLTGDLPSPSNPPSGCRFHTRCPWKQETKCATERPQLRIVDIAGVPSSHRVACHWAEQIDSGEIAPHKVDPIAVTSQDDHGGTEDLMGPASLTEAL